MSIVITHQARELVRERRSRPASTPIRWAILSTLEHRYRAVTPIFISIRSRRRRRRRPVPEPHRPMKRR